MKKNNIKVCIALGATVFGIYLAIHYWSWAAEVLKTVFAAAFPLILGAALAYPVNILTNFYERHFFNKSKNKFINKSRRALSVILALLTLVAIVALVVALVVPQLTNCTKMLVAEIPDFINTVVKKLDEFEIVPEDIINTLKSIDWKSRISDIVTTVGSGLGDVMGAVVTTVSSVISGVTTTFLAITFAVYILLSKDMLLSQIKRLFSHYIPSKVNDKINYVCHIANECFHKFFVAQCTEAVILGGMCMIGMLILRLPYATMIGAVVCVTAFIPVVGGLIGGGIGAFLILMESPTKALIFLVFLILLQQFEGDIIYPKVVGSSIGLPSIWVLAAITVGGGVFGVLGMFLGVPVASTVYMLIKKDMNKKSSTLKATTNENNKKEKPPETSKAE